MDACHNGIADVANRSLDAFQQIACCLTNLVPVLPQQNADCDCSGDCQNDWAEGAGKNRDYCTDYLDNGDDALYNNKGQLNNGNDRFHNRNNGCNHAKDSRDALDSGYDSHHAHGNSADGFTDVCPFFLINLPARQFLEELSDTGGYLGYGLLYLLKRHHRCSSDALKYGDNHITDAFADVADGLLDLRPYSNDVLAQLFAVYASSFEHGSEQAFVAPHERDEVLNHEGQQQEDRKKGQRLSVAQPYCPRQLRKAVYGRSDFLEVHRHEHGRERRSQNRQHTL